jgi:DNA polymerase I-like protein with 3'-5' exonuclease and polymerase domains
MEQLVRDIEAADFMVAHNAKFELGWLELCGLDLAKNISFCTMIGEKVLAGNRQWRLSLNDCLERRGWSGKDVIGKLIRWGWDTRSIPTPWLLRYCEADVRKTFNLFVDQREKLSSDLLLPVTYTRNLLTPVLHDIEKYGLHLDKERVDAVHAYYVAKAEELSATFSDLTDGVNPKSTPQKRGLLYETLGIKPPKDAQGRDMLTDKGELKTDAAALAALKLTTNNQREVVATLKELTSTRDALSKYVSNLKRSADDGAAITGSFTQTVAQTHRLSSRGRSTGIQLQNFQRRFRPCVCARTPGWVIGDGDSAGLEFRTATDLAKDAQGLRDIADGADVHANTARILFADEWDDSLGPKEGKNNGLRTSAKASTFKPLYGGSSGTKAERAYYAAFKKRYSEIADMQAGWTYTVSRTKQLRIASGLIFYWPECRIQESGYITYTTQIYDYPVQSLATADLAPTATVYLWHLMRVAGMKSFLINIVHDSAVGELHPEETERWAHLLSESFNKVIVWYFKQVYDYEWITPLETEVSTYEHWTDKPDSGWLDQFTNEETKCQKQVA